MVKISNGQSLHRFRGYMPLGAKNAQKIKILIETIHPLMSRANIKIPKKEMLKELSLDEK